MTLPRLCLLALVLPSLAFGAAPKPIDPIAARAEKGRAVMAQYGSSVVTIELVATITMTINEHSVPPREQKIEANATVLTPAGLTVTSLANIDPHTAFDMMRMPNAGKVSLGETEFKEVKIKFPDGSEVPAKVILKDADLDLAFIAPDPDKKPSTHTFNPLLLSHATEGQILEDFFTLSRANKSLQQVPEIEVSTVIGIVQKPRKFYLVSDHRPGCPLVSEDGKLLGICVEHSGSRTPLPVILPAADISDLAQQAIALLPKAEAPAKAAK